jgi:hypothetical protein
MSLRESTLSVSANRKSLPGMPAPATVSPYVVPEKFVSTIWGSAEPNTHVQELLLNWIQEESNR